VYAAANQRLRLRREALVHSARSVVSEWAERSVQLDTQSLISKTSLSRQLTDPLPTTKPTTKENSLHKSTKS